MLKCLATDPQDRYPTVAKLTEAVDRLEDQLRLGLVNELKGISRSTSRIFKTSTQTLSRNRRVLIGGVAAVLVALGVLLAALLLKPAAPAAESTRAAAPEGDAFEVEAAPDFDPTEIESGLAIPDSLGEAEETEAATEPTPAPASVKERRAAAPPAAEPAPKPAPPPRVDGDREYKVALDKLRAEAFDPAIDDFEEFIARFPKSEHLPGAYLAIAEAHVGAGRLDEALGAFVEVQSRFPNARESAQATYRHGELLMRSDKRDDALEVFDRAATRFPNSRWAPLALLAKASIQMAEKIQANDPVVGGRVPTALITYRMVAELYGSTPQAEKALRRLAELYVDEKRHDLAAPIYEQLGKSFPDNKVDAWWEAGQLYDRKLKDDQRAIAAYRQVPKSSRNYDSAQKRIARLSR